MAAALATAPAASEAAAGAYIVAVKDLAAFVHRRGDLHYRFQAATLAAEGIARQRAWQQGRGVGCRREVPVAASHGALTVRGRVDGWDAAAGLVDEVKTTRADAAALHRHVGTEHLAQVRLYGALLVLAGEASKELPALRLRLVYLHPKQPDETVFEEVWQPPDLIAYFEATCGCYLAWLEGVEARLARRNRHLKALAFPFASFRGEQRRVAKHAYRGFRDGAHSLVEAPTGSGKTMATVFPALKAMGEGELDRLVFLTARGTGQAAAEAALERCGSGACVAVALTAKARICFNPELPCDPACCTYAHGYYERQPAARRELLATDGVATGAQVAAVAKRHRVCPFELSIDAAAWADVIVADYNYVFDPVVRLKRLEGPLFARAGLVIDEAHQLADRVRAMLGARLPRAELRAALESPGVPAPVAKALRSVDRALGQLPVAAGELCEIPPPTALERAVARAETALLATAVDAERAPALAEATWLLLRFRRAAEAATPGGFHYLASGRGKRRVLELVCTVPSAHIQATLQPFHGSVRLSGTVTPAAVFQRLHGFDAAAPALAVGGGTSSLGVFAVADISTYYRDRERSLAALVALIEDVRRTTPGRCLVAFPSFEYLDAAAARLGEAACSQRPAMDAAARAAFLEEVAAPAAAGAGRIGLVVMGGLFAESVDFDSRAVRSVVVVGPGLPPRSLHRDLIAADESAAGDGRELAYLQPAMTRVAQAVGRVARGGEPGTAVLVDPRFANARYRAYLPRRWRVEQTRAADLPTRLAAFWRRTASAATRPATAQICPRDEAKAGQFPTAP